MDSWKTFDETSLPDEEDFYSNLNMEDITDADYKHAKKVWKNFETKYIGYYHDSYVAHYHLQMYLKTFKIKYMY